MDANDLERYPIGRFERVRTPLDTVAREGLVDAIEQAPAIVRSLVESWSDEQLDLRYRDGGWTIQPHSQRAAAV